MLRIGFFVCRAQAAITRSTQKSRPAAWCHELCLVLVTASSASFRCAWQCRDYSARRAVWELQNATLPERAAPAIFTHECFGEGKFAAWRPCRLSDACNIGVDNILRQAPSASQPGSAPNCRREVVCRGRICMSSDAARWKPPFCASAPPVEMTRQRFKCARSLASGCAKMSGRGPSGNRLGRERRDRLLRVLRGHDPQDPGR